MGHFCSPQATLPKVAAPFAKHPQITLAAAVHKSARTFLLEPIAPRSGVTAPGKAPGSLTLIFDEADHTRPTQLYIDRLPVPSRFWTWDRNRGVLSWRFNAPGIAARARVTFNLGGTQLVGSVEADGKHVGIVGTLAPVSFNCSLALNAGVSLAGQAPALELNWDPTSAQWKNATWVQGALLFTYQVVGQIIVGQKTYSIDVQFNDQQTSTPWVPDTNTVASIVSANLYFTMTTSGGVVIPPDNRQALSDPNARAIPTVFPYQISFQLTDFGNAINGAMLTVNDDQTGVALGLQGTAANPSAVGLYSVEGERGRAGFAVHQGKLWVHDQQIPASRLSGNALSFSGLSPAQQSASGLPAQGTLEFTDDGRAHHLKGTSIKGRRVSADEATECFAATPAARHPAVAASAGLAADSALSLTELANMTQFAFELDTQSGNNVWVDAVQQATLSDFNDVLLYYMPSDLRQTFYGQAQVNLSTALQQIAAMAPTGQDPGAWYQSLAVAFLTNVLSTWDEDGAAQLNALRAQAWLKSQTAASKVFQTQSTAMYAMEWPNLDQNANIGSYLQDQVNNQGTYNTFIAADQQQWLAELQQTILDAASLAQMQDIVNNVATAAMNNGLYWAYAYFRYVTTPQALTEIQMVSLGQTADLDGSAFMRQAQTAAAVLAMLDSSDLFSQQYIQVIQIFQIGNMLPTLFDYSANQTETVSFLQMILNQIAAKYMNSSDPAIAQAAAEAQRLAASQQLAELVATVQGIAAANAGVMAWSRLAPLMQGAIISTIGKIGSSLLLMGLSGIGVFSIVSGVQNWSELTPTERAQLIAGAADFVIQATSSIVKRGVSIATVWDSNVTTWDNLKGLMTSDYLKAADDTLQNGFKSWLVRSGAASESEMFGNLFSEAVDEDESLVTKIFGKNLDEFVSTRLGAAFAVINLVISAINLAHAQGSLDVAGNALLVASSSLELIATAGSWALGAAGVAEIGILSVATICSVLSVLAIVAAVAGIVILLVLAFKKQPTPVQQFGTNQATDAGLYMPYSSAIDYFNGYIDSGGLLRLGVSLFNPINSGALRVNADGSVGSASEDYSYDTVFFCNTDAFGRTQFSTLINSGGTPTPVVLTGNADNSVSFQAAGAAGSDVAARQLWVAALRANPTMDGSHPQSGAFTIQLNGTSNYLNWSNGSATLAGVGVSALWAITQEPMAPAGLSMANLALYTFSQGQVFTPVLQQPGSLPKTWSISPALPAFLAFDTGTGKISQVAGQKPPITPAATFTLSVQNTVSAAPATTTFTITVSQHT